MTLIPCSFPSSNNHKSSRTRPRLEEMWEEIDDGFPRIFKRRRVRRARRTYDGLEALARVAEIFGRVAKERAKASIATSNSINTPQTLSEAVNGEGHHPTASDPPPSTEQPKDMDLIKSEPSNVDDDDADDLVDFRGLATVPRCYASLLERACICHPDLALCLKRSLRWREFAYRTLGELLFFLTTTKRREMTHKACQNLQLLWEDVQDLGFDFSWLAPIIESVLASNSEMENICLLEAEKEVLEQRRNKLHCQLTTLTMELGETEKELAALQKLLQHAKESLVSNEEDFLYTDL